MELSRSEQKRRMKQLEELTEELSALPLGLLDQLPAAEEVRMLLSVETVPANDRLSILPSCCGKNRARHFTRFWLIIRARSYGKRSSCTSLSTCVML
jgi:hypothetical protein